MMQGRDTGEASRVGLGSGGHGGSGFVGWHGPDRGASGGHGLFFSSSRWPGPVREFCGLGPRPGYADKGYIAHSQNFGVDRLLGGHSGSTGSRGRSGSAKLDGTSGDEGELDGTNPRGRSESADSRESSGGSNLRRCSVGSDSRGCSLKIF